MLDSHTVWLPKGEHLEDTTRIMRNVCELRASMLMETSAKATQRIRS